ncbi:lipoprotein LpqH [Mycobacterium hubeiense]|uniref:lipoprotein LpqH n=1 Tax=Mycobacterium hubeiense TaxID=1867256 RepID=UPI000C7F22DD|nr:lipoprotein LpqH [Mycobacterium sp. QGD 101]
MDGRLMAATAALMLGLAGCSTPPPALGASTAEVTIDGRDTGGPHTVQCTQVRWNWIIETPDDSESGFTASVNTGQEVTPASVTFRDLGGFSGTFWDAKPAEAEGQVDDGNFVISGTAAGAFTDKPLERVTVPFKIEANC